MLAVIGVGQVVAEATGQHAVHLARTGRLEHGIGFALGVVHELALAARQRDQLVGDAFIFLRRPAVAALQLLVQLGDAHAGLLQPRAKAYPGSDVLRLQGAQHGQRRRLERRTHVTRFNGRDQCVEGRADVVAGRRLHLVRLHARCAGQGQHVGRRGLRVGRQPVGRVALGGQAQHCHVQHAHRTAQRHQHILNRLGIALAGFVVVGPNQHVAVGQGLPVGLGGRVRRARGRDQQAQRRQHVRLQFTLGHDHLFTRARRQFVQAVQRLAAGEFFGCGFAQHVARAVQLHRSYPLVAGRVLGADPPVQRLAVAVGVGVQRLRHVAVTHGASSQATRRRLGCLCGCGAHLAASQAPSAFAASMKRRPWRNM